MATNDQGNRRFDDGTRDAGDRSAGGTNQWGESARQVWLAGIGAWSRAQAEGSKLFDGLVRDGMEAERESTRTHGAGTASRGTADVRGFASGTWDRMGQFVEDAVQRSLLRLGVPRREDMEALGRRIDALGEELRETRAAAAPASTKPAKKTARTTGEGAATRKPPA
ncbi:MAG TPA: phasin family protein [Xanthomonadaceae bacterium]|nr:phasin family protein [Xanthomonadaceae bacterium]